MNTFKKLCAVAIFTAFSFGLNQFAANAAGFHIQEHGARPMGMANAGAAAMANPDASVVQFNPAIMPEVGRQAVNSTHLIFVQMDATDLGSENGGTNDSDPHDIGVVPNLYIIVPLNEDFSYGFGVNAPFGLSYEWDKGWFGRVDTVKSDLKIINVSNVVAYRFNEYFSVGGGIDFQYVNAELTSFIGDFPFDFDNAFNEIPAFGLGNEPYVEIEGHDFGFGANVGILFTPCPGTRLGVTYRTGMRHKVEGSFKVTNPDGSIFKGLDIDASAKAGLPGFVNVALSQRITDDLVINVDWLYTIWEEFETLIVRAEEDVPDEPGNFTAKSGQPLNSSNSTSKTNYHNAHAISVGLEYDCTEDLVLRAGFKYDQSPVSAEFRNPKTPDNDRYWVSVGFSYDVYEWLTIDAAYTHIFVEEAKVDIDTSIPVPLDPESVANNNMVGGDKGIVKGKFESSVDIITCGTRIRF